MRRPTHPHHTTTAWARPYSGLASMFVCYADGGDPPPPAPQAPKPAPPAEPPHVTYTQDELARLAAKEKDQGRRAGAKAALEEFATEHGFSNVDDAKAFIAAARQAQEAALSEQEKREKALAEREAAAEAREQAALARERVASRRALLAGLGATGDDLDDATQLLRADDDADEATLTAAAEALKTRRPELFGGTTTPAAAPKLPPAPSGAPAGGPPRAPATKDDIKARAMARAQQMGYATKPAA
ncbi:hypothetical protein [Streptomyces diastaticus]